MATGMFTYTPFTSPDSLRLIAILPGPYEAPLQCTLSEHLLEDAPPYECLSYAWGPPDLLDGPSVLVDGRPLPISRELELALRRLRRETGPPAPEPSGVDGHKSCCEPGGEGGRRRMWIDAICINQADILERNAQVARMVDIYRGASCVVAWIGEESEDSTLAIRFLKQMSRVLGSSDASYDSDDSSVDVGRREAVRSSSSDDGDDESSHGEAFEGNHEQEEDVRQRVPEERASASAGNEEEDAVGSLWAPSSVAEDDNHEPATGQNTTWLGTRIRSIIDLLFDLLRRRLEGVDDLPTRYMWKRRRLDVLKAWLTHPISKWKSARELKKRYEAFFAEHVENPKRIGHQLTGVPTWLYYEFPTNDHSYLFEPQFDSSWEALDNLFARPWWSRTWVVQEIWNAEKTVLQCGAAKMRWSHLEGAMEYYEAWDDMGYYVKDTRRWESWGMLKRRYGLVIHIAKKRLLGAKLSDLLWNMWDRDATDPRDKVFALYGLVNDNLRGTLPPVDYAKSTRQVYTEVAANIIQQEQSLDILLAASGPARRGDGLPSWAPDWRREANARRPALFINGARMNILRYFSGSTRAVFFHGHGYSASAASAPIVALDEETAALRVGGVVLDTIAVVGRAWGRGADSSSILRDARSALERSSLARGMRSRTMAAPEEEELRCVLRAGSFYTREESALSATRETQVIENIMEQRRFFVTEGGILGIGPAQLLPGDVVTILSGCNFPMVLRAEGTSYTVLGEAYGM